MADCTSLWGTHIEPMGMLVSETVCTFESVSRNGWPVTWTGGERRGEAGISRVTTVTAIETAGTLDIHWGGSGIDRGLKRCPAKLKFDR